MKPVQTILSVFVILWCAIASAQLPVEEQKEGFIPLFDGKTLNGWDGDPRIWSVRDGIIVGSTEGVTLAANSFLIYDESKPKDFILRAECKLRNGNSGIQFRSETLPGPPKWVMRGLQADIAVGYWGNIYDERGGRRIMAFGWAEKAEKVVRPADWNEVEVHCDGDLVRLKVNGLLTAEIHDSLRTEGLVGLQVHRGPAMEVYFRNIRIKNLR